ncbi:MAG: hypothetical protein J5965_03710 [Aeriscardovia sp.]|nr:hypothetical protein [Aeriscardovia sp.]
MLKLSTREKEVQIDVGHADLYIGPAFDIPYFFETSNRRMMQEPGDTNINFRTWDGEFFQFYMDYFHGKKTLILTSTLSDCCFFSINRLSIDKMKEWAKSQTERKHFVNNSFSGYFTFGRKMLEQYATLERHMEEQEIYFTDEALEQIYSELKRRSI